jgi:hypothetical protein
MPTTHLYDKETKPGLPSSPHVARVAGRGGSNPLPRCRRAGQTFLLSFLCLQCRKRGNDNNGMLQVNYSLILTSDIPEKKVWLLLLLSSGRRITGLLSSAPRNYELIAWYTQQNKEEKRKKRKGNYVWDSLRAELSFDLSASLMLVLNRIMWSGAPDDSRVSYCCL